MHIILSCDHTYLPTTEYFFESKFCVWFTWSTAQICHMTTPHPDQSAIHTLFSDAHSSHYHTTSRVVINIHLAFCGAGTWHILRRLLSPRCTCTPCHFPGALSHHTGRQASWFRCRCVAQRMVCCSSIRRSRWREIRTAWKACLSILVKWAWEVCSGRVYVWEICIEK